MTQLDRIWNGWRSQYVNEAGAARTSAVAGSVFTQILAAGLSDEAAYIVHRGEHTFAILNAFPYTSGHLMVLPYREIGELDELTAAEAAELWPMVTDAVRAVKTAYSPGGVNVGINMGRAAGGSISEHLHVHVVPRWTGDGNFMTAIAETRTLPEPLSQSAAKLRGGVAAMTLTIRPLLPTDDAAAAGAIVQAAYFRLPGYPRDEEYDRLLGEVAERSRDALVVVGVQSETSGDRIVACLTYVAGHDSPHAEFHDEAAASFRYFGVDPSVQGSGVGEAMVQWCMAEARRAGKLRLRIHTLESMPGAQRLYLRMGFERDPGLDEDWDGIKGLVFVYHL